MSVVFFFNASLNDAAPSYPMPLPVDLMRMEKVGCQWIPIVCCFLLCSHQSSSFVSVVFDFNASLNVVVPVSPILFPVDFMRTGKEWIVDGCYLCVVSFVKTTHDQYNKCCV